MAMIQLTAEAAILAMNSIAQAQASTITIEGMNAETKMTFKPRFVGIVLGDNGEIERTPKSNEKFGNLQSTYITVLIDKAEGMLPKLIKKAIMKNAAPALYERILNAANEMATAGGVFPEFDYQGEDIQVGDIVFDRAFRIPNTNTKSGWTEDAHDQIVHMNSRPFVYFKDFENLQTMMRREARNMEYNGHFVDSTTTQQIPTPAAKPVVNQQQQQAQNQAQQVQKQENQQNNQQAPRPTGTNG